MGQLLQAGQQIYQVGIDLVNDATSLSMLYRSLTCKPSVFQLGDLVEVNFSIVTYYVSRQNAQMLLKLCMLALIDSGQSMVCGVC